MIHNWSECINFNQPFVYYHKKYWSSWQSVSIMKWKSEEMSASSTLLINNDSICRSQLETLRVILSVWLYDNIASSCAAEIINWDSDNCYTFKHMPHCNSNQTVGILHKSCFKCWYVVVKIMFKKH